MSQENVEIVRVALEAWNAGDMEALRALLDPDAILRTTGGLAGARTFRRAGGGHARVVDTVRETWRADAVEPISDFTDAGDRVAVRVIWRDQRPRAGVEHRVDGRLDDERRQDLRHRVLLDPRRRP